LARARPFSPDWRRRRPFPRASPSRWTPTGQHRPDEARQLLAALWPGSAARPRARWCSARAPTWSWPRALVEPHGSRVLRLLGPGPRAGRASRGFAVRLSRLPGGGNPGAATARGARSSSRGAGARAAGGHPDPRGAGVRGLRAVGRPRIAFPAVAGLRAHLATFTRLIATRFLPRARGTRRGA